MPPFFAGKSTDDTDTRGKLEQRFYRAILNYFRELQARVLNEVNKLE